MAKFKNTTGFNQVVVINGQKKLVRKDGVLELRDDFIQVGFEKVPDNTPLTIKTSASKVVHNDEVQEIVKRLNDLEERMNSESKLSEVESKIQEISEKAFQLGDESSKDIVELRDLVEVLSRAISNQAQAVQYFKDNEATTTRRLDILKTAIQAMEMQVDEITGFSQEDDQGNG